MLRRRSPLYLPENDPDLFYWFDASDQSTLKGVSGSAITDGVTVYEWHNKGSKITHFAQQGSRTRPTWRQTTINGKPGIAFNGSQVLGLTDVTGITSLPGLTVIAISMRTTATDVDQAIFNVNVSPVAPIAHAIQFSFDDTRFATKRLYNEAYTIPQAFGNTHNVPAIATGIADFNVEAVAYMYRDGILRDRKPLLSTGLSDSRSTTNITVGAQISTTNFNIPLTGYIFEIFLWRRALTPEELVGPHHYLRTKWRIEPATGTALMAPASEPPPSGSQSLLYGPDGEPIESDVEQYRFLLA